MLSAPFPIDVSSARQEGRCWSLFLPLGVPLGDSETDPARSGLTLLEEGRPLGPAHQLHDEIRTRGEGRYSHWGRWLYFSSSDGSDPRSNGRSYAIQAPGLTLIDSPAAGTAAYELAVAEGYLARFRGHGLDIAGKTVLEIGPGGNLGAQLLLACAGARLVVADRFLSPWKPEHRPLYQALSAVWEGDVAPIERALAQGSLAGVITTLAEPAESMPSIATGSMEVVLSNAVLEHVDHLAAAARELRRVSRPGAWHFHQVDFRDHENQSRPLEHMLLDPASFDRARVASRWDRGCQWRLSEVRRTFAEAGFEIARVEVNDTASPAYLADFLPRLRGSPSAYRDHCVEDLAVLGALLILRAA